MSSLSPLFTKVIGQTGTSPAMVEVDHAKGVFIFDTDGKRYMDLNSGYCVSALGHCHPKVTEAIQRQAGQYLHTSVYGEHVQSPQVLFARTITQHLDPALNCVFFVNSGAEAVDGAMKLAKRITGRYEFVACFDAYHGSTQGADSLRSDIGYTNAFMPLLPGIRHMRFSDPSDLNTITNDTAAVIIEPIQAEAGIRIPEEGYLQKLRERCNQTGTLLIFDEIQTGMGRTGRFCAHQHYNVTPDILLLAKALGAGTPLGAIISSKTLLDQFTRDPELGHLTTFGGNPLSCAAGLAGLEAVAEGDYIHSVPAKSDLFRKNLVHPLIKDVRGFGLLLAVQTDKTVDIGALVHRLRENGLITDMFLFDHGAFRIAPPLSITNEEILWSCNVILDTLTAWLS